MATTPTYALPYPVGSDTADVPRDIQALATKLDGTTLPLLQPKSEKGVANGFASLDATGRIPVSQVPATAIPGEIKMWSGSVLPDLSAYGHWVWADGASYVSATYPKAAANIAPAWRTFAGASDPGASLFRVPDLRGLAPMGLDQMPGGTRANRTTRAVAIVLAGRSGEETHVITLPEMAAHGHTTSGDSHRHGVRKTSNGNEAAGTAVFVMKDGGTENTLVDPSAAMQNAASGLTINNAGGNNAHENLPPTVFVPYIVKLDD